MDKDIPKGASVEGFIHTHDNELTFSGHNSSLDMNHDLDRDAMDKHTDKDYYLLNPNHDLIVNRRLEMNTMNDDRGGAERDKTLVTNITRPGYVTNINLPQWLGPNGRALKPGEHPPLVDAIYKSRKISKMRLQSISLLYTAAICSILLACHGHLSKTSTDVVAEPGTIKVIVYHEPPGMSHKDYVGGNRNLAQNLGLPVLTGRYRGSHIRVWILDSTNTHWVIDLRKKTMGSGCTVLSYTTRIKDSVSYIFIHEQMEVNPKSGWITFFNELGKLHIPEMEKKTLPEDREDGFTSMTYVLFEIEGPEEYHFIAYPDPPFFRNEDKTSKMIDNFFRYFNEQMGTSIYDASKYVPE